MLDKLELFLEFDAFRYQYPKLLYQSHYDTRQL